MSTSATIDNEAVPFDAMVYASEIVYSFANLRNIVNENKDVPFVKSELIVTQDGTRDVKKRPNAYLKYPVSYSAIREFIQSNRKFLKNDGGYYVFNKDWKDSAKNDETLVKARFETILEELVEDDAEIWEFDDSMTKDDLVYGCVINRSEKRVTLVFRGSVTLNDWLTDFDARSDEPKDLSFAKEQKLVKRDIRIHKGFSEYLFGIDKGETKSKYTEILEDLSDIYNYKDDNGRDYSEYSLFITGHSLGGALAQLLSFALAGNHEKNKTYTTPVTAVTYASPRVGKDEFRDAFVELEKKKLLRHVRVSNNHDIICTAPPFFVQTGLNVHIYDNGKKADVAYNITKSLWSQSSFRSPAAHMISNYNKNVELEDKDGKNVNEELFKKSVKQLYKEYAKIDV